MDERKIPKLRFKEFENADAWEQRKANEIAEYSKGSGYSKKDLNENGAPIILYGSLYTNYQLVINNVKKFVEPRPGTVYSQGNEVIIPSSGESAEDIARASVITKPDIIIGGDLNILRPFKFIDPIFLAIVVSSDKTKNELSKKAQGKSVVHIHNSDIQEVLITYPSLEEQKLIGNFFQKLDSQITLHQRKLDKLKNIKSAYLSEMFPAEGECKPKRRFPGFTEDWEQRKLGDIVIRESKVVKSCKKFPSIEFEDINSGQGTLNKNVYKKSNFHKGILFEVEDTLFGKLRPYLKNWFFASFSGVAVGDFWVLSPKRVNGLFLYTFIQTPNFYSIANQSTGTKMPRSDWKIVSNHPFRIPVNFKEQKLIGNFFQKLDSQITLHQRKLDKLKNLKQAYLNDMFV